MNTASPLSAAILLPIGLLAAALSPTSSASADDQPPQHHGPDHNQIKGVRFDVHGNLDLFGMFGSGVRLEFAIVPDGFIKRDVHDELALSFGADFMWQPFFHDYYDGHAYVIPIGAVQWNFYLGKHWSVFPELGIAAHIGFDHNGWRGRHWVYAEPEGGFGARFHFTEHVALLMRVSYPGGFQFGVVF